MQGLLHAHTLMFLYFTGACEAADVYLMMVWLTVAEGCVCVYVKDLAAANMAKC